MAISKTCSNYEKICQ